MTATDHDHDPRAARRRRATAETPGRTASGGVASDDDMVAFLEAERAALATSHLSARRRTEVEELLRTALAVARGELPRSAYLVAAHRSFERLDRECRAIEQRRTLEALLAIDARPAEPSADERAARLAAVVAERWLTPDAPTIAEPPASVADVADGGDHAASPPAAERPSGGATLRRSEADATRRAGERICYGDRLVLAYLAERCAAGADTTDEVRAAEVARAVVGSLRWTRDSVRRLIERGHLERLAGDEIGGRGGYRYRVLTRNVAPSSPRRRRTTDDLAESNRDRSLVTSREAIGGSTTSDV